MQVKKFEAPTIQEALDTVKRELGPEAIILQTKKNRRGFGLMNKASVEITAAVSDRSLNKKHFAEKRLPEPAREAVLKSPAEKQAKIYDRMADSHLERMAAKTRDNVEVSPAPKVTAKRYIDIADEENPVPTPAPVNRTQARPGDMGLAEEVSQLKRMIAEMKSANESQLFGSGAQALMAAAPAFTPAIQDVFDQLVINGLDKRYALGLVKKAGFELGPDKVNSPEHILDQIASEIMETTEVFSALTNIRSRASLPEAERNTGPVVMALVGPTGVGKTTTVAKIASEAILRRNLKVGLVNVDSYKVAAFDQLATYAKILNVPFRSAASAEDLRAAIHDFRNLDLVLVDTTGRSQRDPVSLKAMQELLNAIPELQTQLVLSSTTRDAELYDMAARFSMFHPQGLVFSKLDEANLFGALYNVSQKTKLPLVYFTTGQRVPEDLEEATKERMVSLLMDL